MFRVPPPGGVRFAGWMLGIGAFLLCAAGLLFLFIRPDPITLEDAGLTRSSLQLVGFIMLAIGLLYFLLIYALREGSNVARIITTVLVGLSAVGALAQVVGGGPAGLLAWLQLLLDIIIIVCLWGTPNATEFFRKPQAPPAAQPPPPPPI